MAARLVPGPFSVWFLYADARMSLASSEVRLACRPRLRGVSLYPVHPGSEEG